MRGGEGVPECPNPELASLCRREAATICPTPCDHDLESDGRVMCDVHFLCANFSLPRPPCSQLRPDARDRRQTVSSLNAPPRGRGITIEFL